MPRGETAGHCRARRDDDLSAPRRDQDREADPAPDARVPGAATDEESPQAAKLDGRGLFSRRPGHAAWS